jgi:hypothetical protein
MGKKHLILTVALSMLLGACSDGPEQYNRGGGANLPTGDSSLSPDIGSFIIPENYPTDRDYRVGRITVPFETVADDLEDEIVKRNSSQPIVYKKSFSGITFQTEFSEAKNILAEPRGITSNGIYVYKEGIGVFWRSQDPQIPAAVIILPSYLGGFQLNQQLGEIKLGSPVTNHFVGDDGSGRSVIKKYFNALEEKDADYDCLTTSECEVNVVDAGKNLEFKFPNATIQISVDRKIVNYIVLTQDLQSGNLDNSFDIVNSNIPFKKFEGEIEVDNAIKFGENWATTKALIDGQGITTVSTDSFSVQHNGIVVVLSKEKFDRAYEKPEDSELLTGLAFFNPYNKKFKFDGKFLNYKYDLSSNLFKFTKSDEIPADQAFAVIDGTDPAKVTDRASLKEIDLILANKSKGPTYGNVALPIKFKDGSIFYEDSEETASADEIAQAKTINPQIGAMSDEEVAALVISNKKNAKLQDALKKVIFETPSDQTFSLSSSFFDTIQQNKMKADEITIDKDQLQIDYLVGLTNFIKNEIQTKFPGKTIINKYDGFHNRGERGEYASRILVADEATGEGNLILFELSRLSGNLGRLLSLDLDSEFNKKSFPALSKPLEIKNGEKLKEFQGFKLGETVKLSEIDLGRGEATVKSADQSMKERVGFSKEALRSMIFNKQGQIIKETLSSVTVGDLGVRLYLVENKKPGTTGEYKIAQISNSFMPQAIDNLCGLTGLDLKMGMPDHEVVAKINQKINEKRAQDSTYDCTKFEAKMDDGSGKISSITFPEQGIKIYFGGRQLTNFAIYTTAKDALESEEL